MDKGPLPHRPGRSVRPRAMPRRAAMAAAPPAAHPAARLALLLLALAAACGGCAGTAGRSCDADPALQRAIVSDSLAIDPFLALAPAAQAARRGEAADLARGAAQAREPGERIRLAAAAVAAAPDDPQLWLAAADAWRAAGDQLQTATALGGAAAAVRRLNDAGAPLAARGPAFRREAALATALTRAWHHYERAEWTDADDWALAAMQVEPASQGALQLRGLAQGRLGQTPRVLEITAELQRLDIFTPYLRWVLATHDESLGRLRGALNQCLNLRPQASRALECYRDMGALAERLGEWTLADDWYSQSAAASPLAGDPCLERLLLPRLEPGGKGRPAREAPVWLALGRNYITGSLSAYARYALARFEAAADGADRGLWGGLAVNAAGIMLRREPGHPQALRLRGLVFAASGNADLARDDLRRASIALAEAGQPADARVEAELGRLLLAREDLSGALPRLRSAVQLDPQAASAWADLGMALATAGDAEGALAALTRSVELAPDRPTAWYNRGLLHMHAHRLEEAENDLGRAARLAPDNADIARLLQQVRLARTRPGAGGAKP